MDIHNPNPAPIPSVSLEENNVVNLPEKIAVPKTREEMETMSLDKLEAIAEALHKQEVSEWQLCTQMLIGCVLHKLGEKEIKLSAKDLKEYTDKYKTVYRERPDQSFVYEVAKKPKVTNIK